MNLKKFMIDQGSKNVSRKLKDQRKFATAVNSKNKDFINQLSPVKLVNAIHRALSLLKEKLLKLMQKQMQYLLGIVLFPKECSSSNGPVKMPCSL